MNNINFLYKRVRDELAAEKKLFIGIDGLGGSGKSTASESIRAALENDGFPVILLHIDDFIHKRSVRYDDRFLQWECYYNLQWRYDYFIETIRKIRSSQNTFVSVQLYDKENDSYNTCNYTVNERTVIISEGIFLQREELKGLFDLTVFIDVPENQRLERVFLRDTYIGDSAAIAEKYRERYLPAEHYYMEKYSPKETADFIL